MWTEEQREKYNARRRPRRAARTPEQVEEQRQKDEAYRWGSQCSDLLTEWGTVTAELRGESPEEETSEIRVSDFAEEWNEVTKKLRGGESERPNSEKG